MFTLVTDRGKYFRVKRGQTQREAEALFCVPFNVFFAGAIVELGEKMSIYNCQPMESYKTLSSKFGVPEAELRRINFNKPVYPSCKLFVPCKK